MNECYKYIRTLQYNDSILCFKILYNLLASDKDALQTQK